MNKVKVIIMLADDNSKITEKIEEEISYEEYLIIKDLGEFVTSKFNKEGKFDNLFVIMNNYNLDANSVVLTVTRDKSRYKKYEK